MMKYHHNMVKYYYLMAKYLHLTMEYVMYLMLVIFDTNPPPKAIYVSMYIVFFIE